MRFHHMAIMVSDLEKAIELWRDVLGFNLVLQTDIPDGPAAGPDTIMYPELLDDIFKVQGAHSRMALLSSDEGALIELQQCLTPKIQQTPRSNLGYGHTGIHELGLLVQNIESWFDKIKQAGYEPQTNHVWKCASLGRSFIFYDQDGNMIQLWESPGEPSW